MCSLLKQTPFLTRRVVLGFSLLLTVSIDGCGYRVLAYFVPSVTLSSGAWEIHASSAQSASPIAGLKGALVVDGGTVHGAFSPVTLPASNTATACLSTVLNPNQTSGISVTGGVSGSTLTLQSASFAGNVLELTGQIAPDGHSLISGSYSITGSCAMPATSLTAQQYPSLTGQYSGTVTTTGGSPWQIAASLAQATEPDSLGRLALTGTVQYSSPSCSANAKTASTNSSVLGSSSSALTLIPVTGGTAGSGFNAIDAADGNSMTITFWYAITACGSYTGGDHTGTVVAGTLTRQ